MANKDGGARRGDPGDNGCSRAAKMLSATEEEAPLRAKWLRHLQEADALYQQGCSSKVLATMAPVHKQQMYHDRKDKADREPRSPADEEFFKLFSEVLDAAWSISRYYHIHTHDRLVTHSDVKEVERAAMLYRSVLKALNGTWEAESLYAAMTNRVVPGAYPAIAAAVAEAAASTPDDGTGTSEAQEPAAAAPKSPDCNEWLQRLQEAMALYRKGDRDGMLAVVAPLHKQMELDGELDEDQQGQPQDKLIMEFFAPLLTTAWTYSQQYTSSCTDRLGNAELGVCNLRVAALIYYHTQKSIEAWQAERKSARVVDFGRVASYLDGAEAALAAMFAAAATVPSPPPPSPPAPPAAMPKLPLSYTYCFHAAADTWVPAARAARTAAAKHAGGINAAAAKQQRAEGGRSSSTRCHASADGLWLSTPRTYSFDAATDTWALPAAAAKPAAKISTSSTSGTGTGGKRASHVATADGWQPAPTTYTFDAITDTWTAPASAKKAASAAPAGSAVSGGRFRMRYSHFTGGWVKTQPAVGADAPAGAGHRHVRSTYHYDAASDGWVRSNAPAEDVHAAAAAKPALQPAAKHGTGCAASHTCSADGWRPAPRTYAFDPASGTWTLGSAAATAAASTAPAKSTAAAAASCAPAHEAAAAAAAFAGAMSPPAFLAFARRGSPTSKAATPAAAATAAAVVTNAPSPPAALAFARRGSPTSRAATVAVPAAAKATLLLPPQAARAYAYDAARDAWFCPTLDYGRVMPTVCKEPPAAEQQAAPNLDTLTACCPYRRVAALFAAVHAPLERLGTGKLVQQQVHTHEAAFAEEFASLCGCAVCAPKVAAEAEVQRTVVRLARDKLPALECASKDRATDIARTMHVLARDASNGDCFACDAADALLREVWLIDAQALLVAATDDGGRERTVRYLQTAIDHMAAALRRAWRLQPEALMEVKGVPETNMTLLLPCGAVRRGGAQRMPPQGTVQNLAASASAATVEPSQPLKLAGVNFGLPAPAVGSAAPDSAAAAATAAAAADGNAAARLVEAMQQLGSPLLAAARERMIIRVAEYLAAMPVAAGDATAGGAEAVAATRARAVQPPLKTAGIKWGAAEEPGQAALQDTGAKSAEEEWFVPIVAPLQPLKTAGIKWQAASEPKPAPPKDEVGDDTTERKSSASPPWTAAPAVSSTPIPYGVACGTPAAVFDPAAAAPCPFCPPALGNDDEQPLTFCSKPAAPSAAANAAVSTKADDTKTSDDGTASSTDSDSGVSLAVAAVDTLSIPALTGLPALDLTAVLDGFITVPLCKEDGPEPGDAAVIIAEAEEGGADSPDASGPAGSFLADVEAKLAAAAGENVGSSDDEWVHCDTAAADGREQAGSVTDGDVDTAMEI